MHSYLGIQFEAHRQWTHQAIWLLHDVLFKLNVIYNYIITLSFHYNQSDDIFYTPKQCFWSLMLLKVS
jgi:hypothetical protein